MKKVLAVFCLVAVLLLGAAAAVGEGSITVFNWYDYIDENLMYEFTDETGIDVTYVNFTTNEEMFVKLSSGAADYDLIFPSDYIIERMIKQDMIAEINFDNIPNANGILEWLQKPAYDPEGKFSVPYMWGTVGILYNETMVEEPIDSWTQLFSEKYQNNVFMMDSIRDTLGVTLKMQGYSMNTRDEAQLNEAKDLLIEQKEKGIVKAYQVDETKDKMISGEAALALIYSGDAVYSMAENPDLNYVVPKEGSNVWIDAMVIPKNAKNQEGAEKLIDFLCRPDVARRNMEYIGYSSPIVQVVEEMTEEEKANPALNPSQETVENCEFFSDIMDDIALYDGIWLQVRGS